MKRLFSILILVLLMAVVLAACGGGGGGGDGTSPSVQGTIAQAGPDQTVNAGTVVTLDGSASTGPADAVLTYVWTQVSGERVTVTNADKVRATFTAPNVASDQVLVFELTVSDGSSTSTDQVHV